MKKLAVLSSSLVVIFAIIFAVTDSALFINKPTAPKELLKK